MPRAAVKLAPTAAPARPPAWPDAEEVRVALKAAGRVFDAWGTPPATAAALADLGPKTWSRIRRGAWTGTLTQDQALRLSALIGLYKGLHLYFDAPLADEWVSRPNTGPLFGGRAPLEAMLGGGLPAILEIRRHVDALRGGL